MAEKHKPKLGAIFLSSSWFYDVGIQNSELAQSLENTTKEIISILSSKVDIASSEPVHSEKMAHDIVRNINNSEIDMLLICHLTWVEDKLFQTIIDGVKDKNIPVMLWCFNPFSKLELPLKITDLLISSGGVGVLQSGGLLKRKGIKTHFVFGSHRQEHVIDEIVTLTRCAALKKQLKSLNIGLIPYNCDLMTATYVDEFYLKNKIGPTLKYISIEQYREAINTVDQQSVLDLIEDIKAHYSVDAKVTQESLITSAKASLAIDSLACKHDLGAIAVNDLSEELHQRIGLRPGLRLPGMFKNEQLSITMEGDVGAAIAMYIAGQLTDRPCMYSEPLTYDITENTLTMGHAGLTDASIAARPNDIKIIRDYEYQNADKYSGAVNHFIGAKGNVTLLNCTYNGKAFQFVACRGESIGERMILEEGYSHLLVKPDIPLETFFRKTFEAGTTQHWAVAYGDLYAYLEKLASMLPIELCLL